MKNSKFSKLKSRVQPQQQQQPIQRSTQLHNTIGFFNQSFYRQKLYEDQSNSKQHSYTSYQYMKKYFKATRISELINKTVKQTLQSNYLPQNPYNMIGRFLLHQTIFQNIKVFYVVSMNQMKQRGLITRQYKQLKIDNVSAMSKDKQIMIQYQIDGYSDRNSNGNNRIQSYVNINANNSVFMVGWKLKPLLRNDVIRTLWYQLIDKKKNNVQLPVKNKSKKKNKVHGIQNSLGGSMFLRVGCPFTSECLAIVYQFIYMNFTQSLDHYSTFASHIVDDCIRLCETSNTIFIKLCIHTYDSFSIQWSSDNLIHNKLKIVKEIEKAVMSNKAQFRVQCASKVQQKSMGVLGTQFIRYHKVYVLIQQQDSTTKINALNPVKILLTSIHPISSQYYTAICKAMPSSVQQITHTIEQQLHAQIVYHLSNQQPSWVSWALFYSNLYNQADTQRNAKQLKSSIVYMIDTPLYFIEDLRYRINITKLISAPNSISHNQNQVYEILQRCEQITIMQLRKQQHVYPQAVLFLQILKRNLEVILETKNYRNNYNLKPQLQRLQSMLKYLMKSFYQISFVLKGHLLSQIVRIDNVHGKQGSGEIVKSTITYDIFLRKYKNLPDRNLNIVKQIKQLKKTIARSDAELRELILAKYVKKYDLYEKIYTFYWGIVCGKKLNYPMTKFVKILRDQAIRFDFLSKRKQQLQVGIQQTKSDGIMIYQKSADARTQHLFYAFDADALEDQKVKDYRIVKQVFQDFFQSDIISQQSVKHSNSITNGLQTNSYLISIDANIRFGQWQQANFNKCKVYADVVFHRPIPHTEVYKIMCEEIRSKMAQLDKKGFGILGIFCGDNQFLNQDHVYPWTQQDQKFDVNFLRYHSKKQIPYDSLVKLIVNCKKSRKQLLLKAVFWLNGLLKVSSISFNFLINKQWLINQSSTYSTRVFQKHQQIVRWGNYNGLKKYLQTQKQIKQNPTYDSKKQLKEQYLENHIDMIQFISKQTDQNIDIKKVRTFSPFYAKLQQTQQIIQAFFCMLQYLKTDREGKFKLQDFHQTIQILQHYLFEKCLKEDRYIYSQGLSVMIVNLISRMHLYLDEHTDNNGDEKQLIFLQKITIKLMNCVNHCLVSCAFGVLQAIKGDYLDLSDDDDDG